MILFGFGMIANILEVVAASLNDFGKEKHGGVQKKRGGVCHYKNYKNEYYTQICRWCAYLYLEWQIYQ